MKYNTKEPLKVLDQLGIDHTLYWISTYKVLDNITLSEKERLILEQIMMYWRAFGYQEGHQDGITQLQNDLKDILDIKL